MTVSGVACPTVFEADLPTVSYEDATTPEAAHATLKQAREQFFQKLDAVLKVRDTLPSYRFGLAPNGHWKFYQPITCAFMRGVPSSFIGINIAPGIS